jgi:hypothetical protein
MAWSGDPRTFVIVPFVPGPLIRLGASGDEIDEAIHELFGEPDDRGPSAADAALLAGGVGTVVLGQVIGLAGWATVAGALAAALGAILPARALWRWVHRRRLRTVERRGVALRIDHEPLTALVAHYERLEVERARLADDRGAKALEAAHGCVLDAARYLDGRLPEDDAALTYLAERLHAVAELTAAVQAAPSADAVLRRTLAEARAEVDRVEGTSAIDDARALTAELRARGT